MKLVFPGGLQYARSEGLRTGGIPLPFKALGVMVGSQNELAEREGFEPSVGY